MVPAAWLSLTLIATCLCSYDSELSLDITSPRGLPWPPCLKKTLYIPSLFFNSQCGSYMLWFIPLFSFFPLALLLFCLSPPPECKSPMLTAHSSILEQSLIHSKCPINICWWNESVHDRWHQTMNIHCTDFCLYPSSPGPNWIMSGFAYHGNEPLSGRIDTE